MLLFCMAVNSRSRLTLPMSRRRFRSSERSAIPCRLSSRGTATTAHLERILTHTPSDVLVSTIASLRGRQAVLTCLHASANVRSSIHRLSTLMTAYAHSSDSEASDVFPNALLTPRTAMACVNATQASSSMTNRTRVFSRKQSAALHTSYLKVSAITALQMSSWTSH